MPAFGTRLGGTLSDTVTTDDSRRSQDELGDYELWPILQVELPYRC